MAKATAVHAVPLPAENPIVSYTLELSPEEAADLYRYLAHDGDKIVRVARRVNKQVYEIEAALYAAGLRPSS